MGAFALVWMLLQQIWKLACRGQVRGLDDMLADAEAQLVVALRGIMADDPALAHLAGLDYRLEFNGRDYDLVPVGGWTLPPTRFEDHESSAFSLALEVLDAFPAGLLSESWSGLTRPSAEILGSRYAWPRMTPEAATAASLPPLAGEVPAKPVMGASRRTSLWSLLATWPRQARTQPRPSDEILGSRCAWPRMTPSGDARPRMTPLETARPFIRAGPVQ